MIQRGLRFGALVFLVLGLCLPGIALAEEDEVTHQTAEEWEEMMAETYGRKGPYVALSAIASFPSQHMLANGVQVKNTVGPGWNVRFGLRTASWMSIEVLYEQLSKFSTQALGTTRQAKGHAWLLNGKGYFRSNRRVQPFVSVGAGWMSVQPKLTSRRSGFGMRFAAGLDIHLTESIVATAEGGYGRGLGTQVENFDYGVVSAGLGYRF